MFIIITRAVHIGACMILLSLFAFEILVARPALRETDRSASPHMEVLREQFRLLAVWSGFAGSAHWEPLLLRAIACNELIVY